VGANMWVYLADVMQGHSWAFSQAKPNQNNADICLLIYTGTRARFYRALSNFSWTFKLQSLYINVTFPYFYTIS